MDLYEEAIREAEHLTGHPVDRLEDVAAELE